MKEIKLLIILKGDIFGNRYWNKINHKEESKNCSQIDTPQRKSDSVIVWVYICTHTHTHIHTYMYPGLLKRQRMVGAWL